MISYTRRKDREFVELAKPRLSALLSDTPRQILSLIPDAENGLFSRFIFYYMNVRLEWINVFADNEETLDQHFETFGQAVFRFIQHLENLAIHSLRSVCSATETIQFIFYILMQRQGGAPRANCATFTMIFRFWGL